MFLFQLVGLPIRQDRLFENLGIGDRYGGGSCREFRLNTGRHRSGAGPSGGSSPEGRRLLLQRVVGGLQRRKRTTALLQQSIKPCHNGVEVGELLRIHRVRRGRRIDEGLKLVYMLRRTSK